MAEQQEVDAHLQNASMLAAKNDDVCSKGW